MTSNERLFADILRNPHNRAILDRWDALALPQGWLVAGCLFQTVWNLQSGRPPTADINDYDLFYFDPDDVTDAGERRVQSHVDAVLGDLGVTLEATNQARVHLWYEDHFGHPYAPLESAQAAIHRFLVPATCVGVRPGGVVYAPYGLDLLYQGLLQMNPATPHADLYQRKAASYQRRWPWLTLVPPPEPLTSADVPAQDER